MVNTSLPLLKSGLVVSLWLPGFVAGALLYPASTVFQLISSVSLPITDLPPNRKAFFDLGLQMNYDMPFNLSSFYMVPIWPSNDNGISKRDIFPAEFTPTQFYDGLENVLQRYGFHRSCWKRSICELARHPFDESDRNWLTDLLTFVMSPSLIHDKDEDEVDTELHLYKHAEKQGLAGQRCHHLYRECEDNLLDILTTLRL